MNVNIAKSRYTTKKYDSTKKIPEEVINDLKEILRLSPSSINSQPWKFTFVSNEEVKKELAEFSYFNKSIIMDASHLVVFSVIDKIELFEKQIEERLSERAVGYYKLFLKNQSDKDIKSWLSHQVYLSLGFFLSACATLKIDSTPMEGLNSDKYNSILKLKNYKSLFAVAIGYRNSKDPNQPKRKPKSRLSLDEVIYSI